MEKQNIDYNQYYDCVKRDFNELKKIYPYSTMFLPPTRRPKCIKIRVLAVHISIIEKSKAEETDFLGAYSKELYIEVPYDYQEKGCYVYGGKWFDEEKIHKADRHFYERETDGTRLFCIGVNKSFKNLKNVILENVKTADNMLIAYEQVQKGITNRANLIGYSHGEKGEREYERNRRKYRSK